MRACPSGRIDSWDAPPCVTRRPLLSCGVTSLRGQGTQSGQCHQLGVDWNDARFRLPCRALHLACNLDMALLRFRTLGHGLNYRLLGFDEALESFAGEVRNVAVG